MTPWRPATQEERPRERIGRRSGGAASGGRSPADRAVSAAGPARGGRHGPGVPGVLARGPDGDPPWLATLFVAGPSLAEAVTTAGPLPAGPAWRLAAGLAEALAEIHGRGLVHRDLKPANVLLAIDGPRVIDFGISRALEATVMTATGLVVGTPSFMSPEQAGGGAVGAASDVFSLGCLVVFAAAGAGPFGDGPGRGGGGGGGGGRRGGGGAGPGARPRRRPPAPARPPRPSPQLLTVL